MGDEKYFDSFITMKRWLENRNANKRLDVYFKEHNYKTVGIYGAGDLGNLLYEEIKNSEIDVAYFVDRNAEGLSSIEDISVIMLEDVPNHPPIDALIVTPIGSFDEICCELIRFAPEVSAISLKDAVYEL